MEMDEVSGDGRVMKRNYAWAKRCKWLWTRSVVDARVIVGL